jgi:hypothetical protein
MTDNTPVTLRIVFTPQEPSTLTAQAVRDWVAGEVQALTPVFVDHTDDGHRTATVYDITAVELADS